MNGRCDNDPLDTAEEICGLCGGEFCAGCLIATKARNAKFACKRCVKTRAGLRPTEKDPLASKRVIRKRRKALAASAGERGKNGFTYFDDPDSDFDTGENCDADESADGGDASLKSETDGGERKALRAGNRTNRRRLGRLGGRRKTDADEVEIEVEPELSAKSLAVLAQNDEPIVTPAPLSPTLENLGPSATELLDSLRDEAQAQPAPADAGRATNLVAVGAPDRLSPMHLAVTPALTPATVAWLEETANASGLADLTGEVLDPTVPYTAVSTSPAPPMPTRRDSDEQDAEQPSRMNLAVSPFGVADSDGDDAWVPPVLRG